MSDPRPRAELRVPQRNAIVNAVMALSLNPPMMLKVRSRFPRSGPITSSQETALTRCVANGADEGADLLKHR